MALTNEAGSTLLSRLSGLNTSTQLDKNPFALNNSGIAATTEDGMVINLKDNLPFQQLYDENCVPVGTVPILGKQHRGHGAKQAGGLNYGGRAGGKAGNKKKAEKPKMNVEDDRGKTLTNYFDINRPDTGLGGRARSSGILQNQRSANTRVTSGEKLRGENKGLLGGFFGNWGERNAAETSKVTEPKDTGLGELSGGLAPDGISNNQGQKTDLLTAGGGGMLEKEANQNGGLKGFFGGWGQSYDKSSKDNEPSTSGLSKGLIDSSKTKNKKFRQSNENLSSGSGGKPMGRTSSNEGGFFKNPWQNRDAENSKRKKPELSGSKAGLPTAGSGGKIRTEAPSSGGLGSFFGNWGQSKTAEPVNKDLNADKMVKNSNLDENLNNQGHNPGLVSTGGGGKLLNEPNPSGGMGRFLGNWDQRKTADPVNKDMNATKMVGNSNLDENLNNQGQNGGLVSTGGGVKLGQETKPSGGMGRFVGNWGQSKTEDPVSKGMNATKMVGNSNLDENLNNQGQNAGLVSTGGGGKLGQETKPSGGMGRFLGNWGQSKTEDPVRKDMNATKMVGNSKLDENLNNQGQNAGLVSTGSGVKLGQEAKPSGSLGRFFGGWGQRKEAEGRTVKEPDAGGFNQDSSAEKKLKENITQEQVGNIHQRPTVAAADNGGKSGGATTKNEKVHEVNKTDQTKRRSSLDTGLEKNSYVAEKTPTTTMDGNMTEIGQRNSLTGHKQFNDKQYRGPPTMQGITKREPLHGRVGFIKGENGWAGNINGEGIKNGTGTSTFGGSTGRKSFGPPNHGPGVSGLNALVNGKRNGMRGGLVRGGLRGGGSLPGETPGYGRGANGGGSIENESPVYGLQRGGTNGGSYGGETPGYGGPGRNQFGTETPGYNRPSYPAGSFGGENQGGYSGGYFDGQDGGYIEQYPQQRGMTEPALVDDRQQHQQIPSVRSNHDNATLNRVINGGFAPMRTINENILHMRFSGPGGASTPHPAWIYNENAAYNANANLRRLPPRTSSLMTFSDTAFHIQRKFFRSCNLLCRSMLPLVTVAATGVLSLLIILFIIELLVEIFTSNCIFWRDACLR